MVIWLTGLVPQTSAQARRLLFGDGGAGGKGGDGADGMGCERGRAPRVCGDDRHKRFVGQCLPALWRPAPRDACTGEPSLRFGLGPLEGPKVAAAARGPCQNRSCCAGPGRYLVIRGRGAGARDQVGRHLGGEAAAVVTTLVRDMQAGVASRVFGAIGPAAKPTQIIHDAVARAVYGCVDGGIRGATRVAGALASQVWGRDGDESLDSLWFIPTATELVRADMERIEPRCRICRDPGVRRLVNDRLDWRGVPIPLSRGKTHRVTYADICRDLAALNEGRHQRDLISYDCLWVHAKRHYDRAGRVAACRRIRMYREFRNALRTKGV